MLAIIICIQSHNISKGRTTDRHILHNIRVSESNKLKDRHRYKTDLKIQLYRFIIITGIVIDIFLDDGLKF